MAATAPPDFFARLAALDLRLRSNGFTPDPARWLNVHDLLARLARGGRLPKARGAYCALLAPLLCANKEQQADFRRIFDDWTAAGNRDPVLSAEPSISPELQAREQRVLLTIPRGCLIS